MRSFRLHSDEANHYEDALMTRIDFHWVIDGDTAQQMLIDQGYDVAQYQTRHGVRWARMAKEVAI